MKVSSVRIAPFLDAGAPFRHGPVPALLGLVLPLAFVLWSEGAGFLPRLALLLVLTIGWQALFSRLRGLAMEPGGVVTALIVALLVPAGEPLWQLALGISFGVVIGEQIFGGRGRNFVHPAVVALAFLMFSFTDGAYRAGPEIPAWTLLPALVLLLASGQAAWRTLLGIALAAPAILWLSGGDPLAPFLSGAILLAVLFLAADPVASAATNAGRLAYGFVLGALAALFSQAGEFFGAVLFATLMASIFVPLIDQLVIMAHMRWREARQEKMRRGEKHNG